jgi:hypothetical protein
LTIRKNKGRVLVAAAARADLFDDAKQAVFLGHFAATCNLLQSAAAAGVSRKTVYQRRRFDEAFAEAFARAEESGVECLRGEMVRRSLALLRAATPDEVALASLPGLDCHTIMNLLDHHERGLGKASGERRPRRSDASEAAARLKKLLERMRAEHKRELALKRAAKAAGAARLLGAARGARAAG